MRVPAVTRSGRHIDLINVAFTSRWHANSQHFKSLLSRIAHVCRLTMMRCSGITAPLRLPPHILLPRSLPHPQQNPPITPTVPPRSRLHRPINPLHSLQPSYPLDRVRKPWRQLLQRTVGACRTVSGKADPRLPVGMLPAPVGVMMACLWRL